MEDECLVYGFCGEVLVCFHVSINGTFGETFSDCFAEISTTRLIKLWGLYADAIDLGFVTLLKFGTGNDVQVNAFARWRAHPHFDGPRSLDLDVQPGKTSTPYIL